MTVRGYGALGGAAVAIAALFVQTTNPILNYIEWFDASIGIYALVGWIVRLMFLVGVGAFWVSLSAETSPTKAIQLGIAAPAVLAAMLGVTARDFSDYPISPQHKPIVQASHAVWAGIQGRPLSPREIEAAVPIPEAGTRISGESGQASKIASDLISRFSGSERKAASDALARYHDEHRGERNVIVAALINAIEPSDKKYSYRINLYIARTLGVMESWVASPDQKQKVEQLGKIFDDETMKYWVAVALRKSTAKQ